MEPIPDRHLFASVGWTEKMSSLNTYPAWRGVSEIKNLYFSRYFVFMRFADTVVASKLIGLLRLCRLTGHVVTDCRAVLHCNEASFFILSDCLEVLESQWYFYVVSDRRPRIFIHISRCNLIFSRVSYVVLPPSINQLDLNNNHQLV